jgi:hypothetical protein
MYTPQYEHIAFVSHADAEAALESGNLELMARTLIALGLHDSDWRWVQQQCLRFLSHSSEIVVSAAVLSLAHTARVNQSIDKDVVVPALQALVADSRYAGKIQDALDDIDVFVKHA